MTRKILRKPSRRFVRVFVTLMMAIAFVTGAMGTMPADGYAKNTAYTFTIPTGGTNACTGEAAGGEAFNVPYFHTRFIAVDPGVICSQGNHRVYYQRQDGTYGSTSVSGGWGNDVGTWHGVTSGSTGSSAYRGTVLLTRESPTNPGCLWRYNLDMPLGNSTAPTLSAATPFKAPPGC
jgi:hypothetical protein